MACIARTGEEHGAGFFFKLFLSVFASLLSGYSVLVLRTVRHQQITRIKKQPFGSVFPPSRLMVKVETHPSLCSPLLTKFVTWSSFFHFSIMHNDLCVTMPLEVDCKVKLWSYYKELSCFFHTHFKINKILQKLYTPFKTDNKEYGVVQQKYIFMPQFVSKQSNILELQNTFHLYANVQSIVLQNIAL
jgi:hypothetical protein